MAAALAGVASFQACTVNNNNTTGDEQDGGESSGGKNTAGSSMATAGADDEGGASTGVGGSSGTVGGAADEGGAAQGGASSSVGGADDQGGSGQGGAATCDDTVGAPTCDGVHADCTSYCNAAVANLKPAAAVDAVTCLEADTAGGCDTGYSCLSAATAKGCPEDVTAACEAAATACTSNDVSDPPCGQLLSGLNEAARALAITCTEESCFSVYSCAEGLFFQ